MAHEQKPSTPPNNWIPRPALPHEVIVMDRQAVERDMREWEANEGSAVRTERFARERRS